MRALSAEYMRVSLEGLLVLSDTSFLVSFLLVQLIIPDVTQITLLYEVGLSGSPPSSDFSLVFGVF